MDAAEATEARTGPGGWVLAGAVLLLVLGLDQLTKALVRGSIAGARRVTCSAR